MQAVLNGFLEPKQDAGVRRGMGQAQGPIPTTRFYAIGSTMSLCRLEPVWPPLAGCIDPNWLQLAGSALTRSVESQLGESLPIRCEFTNDVQYLAAHSRRIERSLFAASRPTSVIAFSAPVYVGRTTIIFYRHFWHGGGVVRLESAGTAWEVRGNDGWVE